MMEGAMEIVFWVIIAIIVLAIFYVCAVSLRKRKEAFEREPSKSDIAPDTKEHGIDLQARRKTYDDIERDLARQVEGLEKNGDGAAF
jgi:hypothetical protein